MQNMLVRVESYNAIQYIWNSCWDGLFSEAMLASVSVIKQHSPLEHHLLTCSPVAHHLSPSITAPTHVQHMVLLLMEEILHQLTRTFFRCLQTNGSLMVKVGKGIPYKWDSQHATITVSPSIVINLIHLKITQLIVRVSFPWDPITFWEW